VGGSIIGALDIQSSTDRVEVGRGDAKPAPHKNKSWSRQLDDSKKKGQRELAAFIKKVSSEGAELVLSQETQG
jgi:hypothetical protein